MKDFLEYSASELAAEESFQDFVLKREKSAITFWEMWIQEHPDKKDIFEQARSIVKSARQFTHRHYSSAFGSLEQQLEKEPAEKKHSRPPILHKYRMENKFWESLGYRIAASIVALLVIGGFWFALSNEQTGNTEALETNKALEQIVKLNPKGQKSTIFLPDGTQVKLNAESKLSYPSNFFHESERRVQLEGEAFFDVVESDAPFIIKGKNIEVKVLGTSFNVRAYPTDNMVQVAVLEGLVSFQTKTDTGKVNTVQLRENEAVEFEKRVGEIMPIQFEYERLLGWKMNILLFENADMRAITEQLERWYGVEIISTVKKPILKGFTGRFHNKSLESILEGISFALDFNYRIEGEKVYFF